MIITSLLTAGATALALTPSATSAAAQPLDGDAELIGQNRIHLSAETRGADRVTFLYNGKSHKGRLTETDREDRTRDWDRVVKAKRSDRQPGRVVSFKVRACDGGQCTTRRFSERVEWDD